MVCWQCQEICQQVGTDLSCHRLLRWSALHPSHQVLCLVSRTAGSLEYYVSSVCLFPFCRSSLQFLRFCCAVVLRQLEDWITCFDPYYPIHHSTMRCSSNIISLPASILLLVISQTYALQSSRDGRSSASQSREIEDIESLVEARTPVGVMKMSLDEGEKFYQEYWQFPQAPDVTAKLKVLLPKDESLANVSMHFTAPLGLHTYREGHYDDLKARRLLEGRNAAAASAILEKRDFVCPTAYNSCAAIGYPNSCCSTSETCFAILDTGLGPVGCCENGYSCGGTISTCGTVNTACGSSLGGGCCIPGFACAGVGCEFPHSMEQVMHTDSWQVSRILLWLRLPSLKYSQCLSFPHQHISQLL